MASRSAREATWRSIDFSQELRFSPQKRHRGSVVFLAASKWFTQSATTSTTVLAERVRRIAASEMQSGCRLELLLTVQHSSCFLRQRAWRERLLEKRNLRFQNAVAHDGIGRIARYVQHSYPPMQGGQPLGDLAAISARQNHVGHEQINFPGISRCDTNGFNAVARFQHGVVALHQNVATQSAHRVVIFHQQHNFATLRERDDPGSGLAPSLLFRHSRDVNFEGRSATEFAVDADVASALFDNAVHGCQPKPRATFTFGREKWLEKTCDGRAVHSTPGIRDRQKNVWAGGRLC